jgi:hypothetical protein
MKSGSEILISIAFFGQTVAQRPQARQSSLLTAFLSMISIAPM